MPHVLPIFHGLVSDDCQRVELRPNEKALRKTYLKRLGPKCELDIVIKKHRNKRSDRQLRWYWGVAIPILADALGYDKDEHELLHYSLLCECFGMRKDERAGREVPNVVSSSALDTKQFSEFMEWLVRWSAREQAVVIPLPNEGELT